MNSAPKANFEIDKPLRLKVVELIHGLQLLRDAITQVRQGKTYHLAVLSGQLRGMLFDNASRAEKRLLQIASEFGVDLKVYHMSGVDDPAMPLKEKIVLHVAGLPITAQRVFRNQVETDLASCLNFKIVEFNGTSYPLRTIVEWFANKAGGAHYSKKVPKDFAELLEFQPLNFRPLQQILVELAEATVANGVVTLNSASQFDFHFSLAVLTLPKDTVCLLDAAHPQTSMRFSLLLDKSGTPIVRFVGIDGTEFVVRSERIVDWVGMHHLSISTSIDNELATIVEIRFDGEVIARSRFAAPVFVLGNWVQFDVHFNRTLDGKDQDFSYGMGEFVSFGREQSAETNAQMLVRFVNKFKAEGAKAVLLEDGAYARAQPGERDLAITGKATSCSASSLRFNSTNLD